MRTFINANITKKGVLVFSAPRLLEVLSLALPINKSVGVSAFEASRRIATQTINSALNANLLASKSIDVSIGPRRALIMTHVLVEEVPRRAKYAIVLIRIAILAIRRARFAHGFIRRCDSHAVGPVDVREVVEDGHLPERATRHALPGGCVHLVHHVVLALRAQSRDLRCVRSQVLIAGLAFFRTVFAL